MKLVIITQYDPIFTSRFLKDIEYSVFDDIKIYTAPNFGSGKIMGLKKFIKLFGFWQTAKETCRILFTKSLKYKLIEKRWDDICSELLNQDLTNTVLLSVSAPHKIPELLLEKTLQKVNVHCGKLPQYAGMMPVFWQHANQQKSLCITLHQLSEEIDEGSVIKEMFVPRTKNLLNDMKKVKTYSALLFNSYIMEQLEVYDDIEPRFNKYPSDQEIKQALYQ